MATIAPGFGLTVGLCMAVALLLILSLRRLRVSIEDGVKALELADAATTSWRENRIVRLR